MQYSSYSHSKASSAFARTLSRTCSTSTTVGKRQASVLTGYERQSAGYTRWSRRSPIPSSDTDTHTPNSSSTECINSFKVLSKNPFQITFDLKPFSNQRLDIFHLFSTWLSIFSHTQKKKQSEPGSQQNCISLQSPGHAYAKTCWRNKTTGLSSLQ